MKILYITYIDFDKLSSGSSVRPKKMYDAMLECGHQVLLLKGSQAMNRKSSRRKAVEKAKEELLNTNVDFCYIESSTYPILHSFDRALIKYVTNRGIPTAYFYRDCYHLFPELQKKRSGLFNVLKKKYLDFLYKITDELIKKCDIVYFPSEEFSKLYNYKNTKLLPPAGEIVKTNDKMNTKTAIYVGGVSERYGFELLINSFLDINAKGIRVKLILVCRKDDFEQYNIPNYEWLSVYHVCGFDLDKLYRKADIALHPAKITTYNNFAVSVKLFEYMSYSLPMVVTNNAAMAKIINDDNIGIVTDGSSEAFSEGILRLIENDELLKFYQTNIFNALRNKHLWVHRVQTICRDLSNFKTDRKWENE